MTISPADYRDALRLFPAGVTVVTIRAGERIHGLTVSAFASVSPEPPLIAIMIDHQHGAHALLELPGAVFAVNVLGEDQAALSDRFAWSPDLERFELGDWMRATTGAPVLRDALAWLDCTLHSRHTAGSHTLYIGEVVASATPRAAARPLVYWNRGYRALAADTDSE
jgi:flavin reductase (DIM6/NTAB) family NADH-FMN oxidoreductase RutF